MSTILIRQIAKLVQVEGTRRAGLRRGAAMAQLPAIDDAFLLVGDGRILDFGPMAHCPDRADEAVDARGGMVFPSWCDAHTHLVYAASREAEFVDRIRGLSYEEIARRGGGILNSARRLRATPEEALFESALERLREVQSLGTGAIEIKSGYGLSVESELKMLRVIRRLKAHSAAPVKATFLGAHALPEAFRDKRQAYIDLLTDTLLPQIAGEGLADYIDVFCERGFFTAAETERLLLAGLRHGLPAKIHTNQFTSQGGIEVAIRHGAVSVDHLEVMTEEEIALLRRSPTIPTLLPSAAFFLNAPYPPARRMIDAGLGLALASDYNPGTTPSGRMAFVLSLACLKMHMTPAEAVNGATINGAAALQLDDSCGSIARGKRADFFITRPIPSIDFLPYAFGSDLIEAVYLAGRRV